MTVAMIILGVLAALFLASYLILKGIDKLQKDEEQENDLV